MLALFSRRFALCFALAATPFAARAEATPGANPILRDCFTADPSPLRVGDTVYLYVGHDEAKGEQMFNMNAWLCYSSTDLKTWTRHGPIMKPTDFSWAVRDAWAAQVVAKDGKFYLYATVHHDNSHQGKAIGVAVSDNPTGPFTDARGSALIHEAMTPGPYGWDDIDPTVLIDDDGTPYLAWGNPTCHFVKLKPNMIDLDGPIQRLPLPNYTEGPWLSKRNGLYYLTYPSFAHQGFAERLCYATAPAITGPWTYRGQLTGPAKNSYTIHPGILDDFKGHSYLFYHNAALSLPDGQTGATGRRAVCVEYLHYNPDGTMQPVTQTEAGISVTPSPAPYAGPASVNRGVTDTRISIAPINRFFPETWSGEAVLATLANPFNQGPVPVSFNQDGGVTSLGQTFTPEKDMRLGRIALYAGDGFGTDADDTLTLALYDLGPDNAPASDSYTVGPNLLGDGQGLRIAYDVQAPGEWIIDLEPSQQSALLAGHRYVLELQGKRDSNAVYWRRSRTDVYAVGAAYRDRKLLKERDGQGTDFALALHEAR